MKTIRKECRNNEGKYCKYLDTDKDCTGVVIPYCVYSIVECNPTF